MTAPKRIPAFQFYAHAWLSSMSVTMMPAEVEGTYIRLLSQLWIGLTQGNGRLLPSDPKQMRALTKLSESQWKKAWPMLEEHFPIGADTTGRTNPTLHAVWLERLDFQEKQRENGANGGRPPRNPKPPKEKPKRNPEITQAFPLGSGSRNPNESSGPVTDSGSGFGSENNLSSQPTTNDVPEAEVQARGRWLVVAANKGISERFGEQPNPMRATAPNSYKAINDIHRAGVDFDFAVIVIYEYTKRCNTRDGRPPQTLGYFTRYVVDRWEAAIARREADGFTPSSMPDVPERDAFQSDAIAFAQDGNKDFQRYCDEHNIPWRQEDAA